MKEIEKDDNYYIESLITFNNLLKIINEIEKEDKNEETKH